MGISKKAKDQVIKLLNGGKFVPAGLFEMSEYFRHNEPIEFKFEKGDGVIVAVSKNFRFGSIVTSGKDQKELDKNIKDAILTSFEVPCSYKNEARIHKLGDKQKEYALA